MAAEELKHIDFIPDKIDPLNKGAAPNVALGEAMEDEGFFSQRAVSEAIDSTVLGSLVPDLPVLRMACLIERDFAEFYQNAAVQAEGESKKVLRMLAEGERGHEKLFKQYHDQAFEKYSGMPWSG